jgi:hypothetical protein
MSNYCSMGASRPLSRDTVCFELSEILFDLEIADFVHAVSIGVRAAPGIYAYRIFVVGRYMTIHGHI